jgi:hypothetical protein
METPTNLMKTLMDSAASCGKTTLGLAKLKTLEIITTVATSLITRQSVILAVSMFALVINIGIALLLGDLLGKSHYVFFIVTAFYFVVAVGLHFLLPTWAKKTISGLTITEALD